MTERDRDEAIHRRLHSPSFSSLSPFLLPSVLYTSYSYCHFHRVCLLTIEDTPYRTSSQHILYFADRRTCCMCSFTRSHSTKRASWTQSETRTYSLAPYKFVMYMISGCRNEFLALAYRAQPALTLSNWRPKFRDSREHVSSLRKHVPSTLFARDIVSAHLQYRFYSLCDEIYGMRTHEINAVSYTHLTLPTIYSV